MSKSDLANIAHFQGLGALTSTYPLWSGSPQPLKDCTLVLGVWSPNKPGREVLVRGELSQPAGSLCSPWVTYLPPAETRPWPGRSGARYAQRPPSGWSLLAGPGQRCLQRARQQPGSPRWSCLRVVTVSPEGKRLAQSFGTRRGGKADGGRGSSEDSIAESECSWCSEGQGSGGPLPCPPPLRLCWQLIREDD